MVDGITGELAYPGTLGVEGVGALDGKVSEFLKRHKKPILIGAGVLAVGIGTYFLIKYNKNSASVTSRTTTTRRRTGVSGVGRVRRRAASRSRRRHYNVVRIG